MILVKLGASFLVISSEFRSTETTTIKKTHPTLEKASQISPVKNVSLVQMIWNLKIDVRCNACHRKFYAPRHNSQQRTDPSALNDAEPDSIINRVDEFQMSCTNAWCSFCVSYDRE